MELEHLRHPPFSLCHWHAALALFPSPLPAMLAFMPAQPLSVTLSDGQKIDVLKRFRKKYGEELEKIEAQVVEILTALQEADFMVQYVGEQPEVKELRARKSELEAHEARRLYLSKLIDRLDAVIPSQPEIHATLAGSSASAVRPGMRRY
jgi:hypothetical protein